MTEQLSLLNEFREPGFEAAVLTTFNCHIPFLEDVVVRRLHAAGCRHIVVLADHAQLIKAVRADVPRRAGRDYHLLPVQARGAFHPKVFLLAGRAKGCLVVGSHNLTYAGLGSNREVTSALRYRPRGGDEYQAIIQLAWRQLQTWILTASEGFDKGHRDLLTRIEQLAPWLTESAPAAPNEARLVFGGPGTKSLIEEFQRTVRGPAKTVVISGAFFDSALAMLKRMHEVLRPNSMTIAFDPDTVQIRSTAGDEIGADFVRADKLGISKEAYLHAKFVHVVDADGQHHLWAGSANPSAPAWLAAGDSANHEAMVALRGGEAEVAATALGLERLRGAVAIGPADWQALNDRVQREATRELGSTVGQRRVEVLSVTDPFELEIDLPGHADEHTLRLIDTMGRVYRGPVEVKPLGNSRVQIVIAGGGEIAVIEVLRDDEVLRTIILHHLSELHEQARTGIQRRFRSALTTLGTDTPDIVELFKCIESVVTGEETKATEVARRAAVRKGKTKSEAPESLEISIRDIGQLRARHRLTAHSDLGYVLDYLIKVLGEGLESNFEKVDLQGRTEEELVQSDDETTESEVRTEAKAEEILALCHQKVKRLANRVKKQMAAFSVGKVADRAAVNCTVAVLMLLRQLRGHDKHIWWVNEARGETTVPDESLATIARAVTNAFLGHPLFSPVPKSDDPELPRSEEFGRLRGLLFWLAARSGLELKLTPGFNETQKERETRLQRNANFLALSELVAGDLLAEQEARQAIATTEAADGALLDRAVYLHAVIHPPDAVHWSDSPPQPGDLAVHPEVPKLGIRVVLRTPGENVQLASPGGRPPKGYLASKLRCMSAQELAVRMTGH